MKEALLKCRSLLPVILACGCMGKEASQELGNVILTVLLIILAIFAAVVSISFFIARYLAKRYHTK
jgi:hypothetical protein